MVAVATLGMLTACSQSSAVLDRDRMADILVDVHKAEGLFEAQPEQYESDAAKERLVLAVLEKHGVTKADYDSSLVWYSAHLKEFIRVYNQVRTRMTDEQDSLKALLNVDVTSAVGDTVELLRETPYGVWDGSVFAGRRILSVPSDSNFRASDSVAWSFRVVQLPKHYRAVATLSLLYDADSMQSQTCVVSEALPEGVALGRSATTFDLGLQADSTLQLKEVMAALYVWPTDTTKVSTVLVDSLSLRRYHLR